MYHKHITKEKFCSMVDYALLSQCNPREKLDKWCDDTIKYGFGSLCIFPCDVAYAKKRMGDKGNVCAVVGYPMGANTTETKVFEALQAIDDGASELDIVMNISRFMDHDDEFVLKELKTCVNAIRAKDPSVIIKIIIEVYWLDKDDDLKRACELVIASGADYVKQATGYAPDPYHNTCGIENMARLREICGDRIKLKSAGVPDNLEQCVQMYKQYNIDKFGGHFVQWLEEAGDDFWNDK
jgi:deoxyribose-phosphate aldolase